MAAKRKASSPGHLHRPPSSDSGLAVAHLRGTLAKLRSSDPEFHKLVGSRDEVFATFQPILTPEHAKAITEDEFRMFLSFDKNQHWTGLHRQGPRICADMKQLRRALVVLLDESQPIAPRLDQVVSMVSGMGKAIITAILTVAHPDAYGVWNNTSEGALKELGLFPAWPRGTSFGERYARINAVLLRLSMELGATLWEFDSLMWRVLSPRMDAQENPNSDDMVPEGAEFGLERHLHEFLFDNWARTGLAADWEILTEPGEPEKGYEFSCGPIGRIDILARHRKQRRWLVIELKRGQSSDETVGQVLRYMGYVKHEIADPGDRVEGLIIARVPEDRLRYALASVPDVQLMSYVVDFRLAPVPLLAGGGTKRADDRK